MLQTVFVKQVRIASLTMLTTMMLLCGAPSITQATGLIPIHGLVLSQASAQNLVLRIDPVPGMLPGTIRRLKLLSEKKNSNVRLTGREVDGFLDSAHGTLSELHPANRYTAGLPDEESTTQLRIGDRLPDLHFIDQHGQMISLAALRGKTLILSFFYTRCPDREICPAISGRFAYLQSRIDTDQVQLLEITVDPRNDSPANLAAYAQQFGADATVWHLLTAQQHTIADMLALFGLSNLESNPGNFVHDDVLAFIGPDARLTQTITTAGWSPDDVLATIAHVNGQSGNWFRRMELESTAKLVSACGGSTTAAVAIMDSVVFVLGVVILGSVLAWFAKRIWGKPSC